MAATFRRQKLDLTDRYASKKLLICLLGLELTGIVPNYLTINRLSHVIRKT